METLQYRIKEVYGRPLIYPVNETANLFCKLLVKKTLTDADLKIAEQLGHKLERVM